MTMIVHQCKKVVNGSERCDKNIQRDYRDSLSIRTLFIFEI